MSQDVSLSDARLSRFVPRSTGRDLLRSGRMLFACIRGGNRGALNRNRTELNLSSPTDLFYLDRSYSVSCNLTKTTVLFQ